MDIFWSILSHSNDNLIIFDDIFDDILLFFDVILTIICHFLTTIYLFLCLFSLFLPTFTHFSSIFPFLSSLALKALMTLTNTASHVTPTLTRQCHFCAIPTPVTTRTMPWCSCACTSTSREFSIYTKSSSCT